MKSKSRILNSGDVLADRLHYAVHVCALVAARSATVSRVQNTAIYPVQKFSRLFLVLSIFYKVYFFVFHLIKN